MSVNGRVAALGTRVHEGDQVRLDGRLIRQRAPAERWVFLCHRSPGEALQRSRAGERPALLERLPQRAGKRFTAVSPMPHADGGLELVTSDGALAERLQRAVHALEVEFSVRLRGELHASQLSLVAQGELDSGAPLEVLSCEPQAGEGSNRWYVLASRGASGKEVRRLFERAGALVSRVLRTRVGPVRLERALARGQFRRLTDAELTALFQAAAAHRSSSR